MTALKREVIQLVEQMPEEQMPYVIQYIHTLKNKDLRADQIMDRELPITPKMAAFQELKKMLIPMSLELDYDKELAEARNEKYGYTD